MQQGAFRHRADHYRLARRWCALAFVVVAAMAIAACGSSSSTGASTSAASPGSASSTSASTSACMSQARQVVQKAQQPVGIEAPTQAIDASKLKGKLVYLVSIPSGYSERLWQGFQVAAKAAGLDPVFGSGDTPQEWNTSIQQAVARHASGIFLMAITPSLVASSLAQAKAAGIPVMSQNSIPPAPTDIAGTVVVPVANIGTVMAAYTALDNNCKVDALVGVDPTFSGTVALASYMKAEFHRLCPTTCKLNNLDISIATMATQAAPALQSALQRDPSVNAVLATFDSLALVMAPGLEQSGSKAKLYGTNGDPANLALVQKGLQASDYAYVPTSYQGYVNLDLLMRAMLKVPINAPNQQVQLFTTATLPKDESIPSMWPKLAGYQSRFMKLWGLG